MKHLLLNLRYIIIVIDQFWIFKRLLNESRFNIFEMSKCVCKNMELNFSEEDLKPKKFVCAQRTFMTL